MSLDLALTCLPDHGGHGVKWLSQEIVENMEILGGPMSAFNEWGKTLAKAHDKIANTKGTHWACHLEGRHKFYSGGQSTLVDRSRHTTSQQVWTMSQP